MRALALVMADLERDALGAPSTLEAELAGRAVLRATLPKGPLCRSGRRWRR